jgi:hypothetical protein
MNDEKLKKSAGNAGRFAIVAADMATNLPLRINGVA